MKRGETDARYPTLLSPLATIEVNVGKRAVPCSLPIFRTHHLARFEQIKKVVRDLLATLKREKLVLDWRKKQQARADVRLAVEQVLDTGLPVSYTGEMYQRKCEEVFQHIYDSYFGPGQSIYTAA